MGEWLRIEPEYRGVFSQIGLDNLKALLAGPGERVRHSLHTNAYRLELPNPHSDCGAGMRVGETHSQVGDLMRVRSATSAGPSAPPIPATEVPAKRAGKGGGAWAKVVYVKTYREAWPRLKYFFRRSRALREWRVLRGLQRRGIPAARPVAVGERRRFRALLDAVLVTEEVQASVDLERFLPQFFSRPRTPGWRRKKRLYLEVLARFTRAMHDAGYVSGDFHWRNILVVVRQAHDAEHSRSVEGESAPRFAIIDNPRGLFHQKALARWLGVGDLAALDREASAYLSRTDRLRFLRAYAGRPLRRCRRLLQRIGKRRKPPVGLEAVGASLLSCRLAREGRCWAAFREGGGETPTRLEMLTPEGLLQASTGNAGGRLRTWQRTSLLPLAATYGPCGREWQNLESLGGLGLAAPRWLAFAQERAWGLARREALVVTALSDVEPLGEWLQRSGTRGLRRALAEALGREIARAHAGGFCWKRFTLQGLGVRLQTSRPPSASSLLVPRAGLAAGIPEGRSRPALRHKEAPADADGGEASVPEPVFLDVEAGVRRRRLSRRERVGDLVSLAACFSGQVAGARQPDAGARRAGLSAGIRGAEMLRFFRGYLGRKLTSVDKALVREVVRRYLKVERGSRPALVEGPPTAAEKR